MADSSSVVGGESQQSTYSNLSRNTNGNNPKPTNNKQKHVTIADELPQSIPDGVTSGKSHPPSSSTTTTTTTSATKRIFSTASNSIFSTPASLVRKHSSGDLVSRLKSRKILGVGGGIYRSKISQLLGHSEHLFIRFPSAFWHWYWTLITIYSITGFWILLDNVFGQYFMLQVPLSNVTEEMSLISSQQQMKIVQNFNQQQMAALYLALATVLWYFNASNDKHLIRFLLSITTVLSLVRIVVLYHNYGNCGLFQAYCYRWLIRPCQLSPPPPDSAIYNRKLSILQMITSYLPSESTKFKLSVWMDVITIVINSLYRYRLSLSSLFHSNSASNQSSSPSHNTATPTTITTTDFNPSGPPRPNYSPSPLCSSPTLSKFNYDQSPPPLSLPTSSWFHSIGNYFNRILETSPDNAPTPERPTNNKPHSQ